MGGDQGARRTEFAGVTLRTPRLDLRPFVEDDLEDLMRLKSDPEVVRWLPYGPRSAQQVRESLGQSMRLHVESDRDAISLCGMERYTGAFVGEFLLILDKAAHRGWEIGYVLDPRRTGRGYATEGARAMLAYAFDRLEAHRVIGRIYSEHAASARVLRKLGMRQEAHLVSNELLDGEWTDEIDFALLEHEWRALDRPDVVVIDPQDGVRA